MKYLDLFSGIGGFALGIQQAYATTRDTDVPKVGGGQATTEGKLSETGEGLYTIPTEATIPFTVRDNELPNTSLNQGQPDCIGFSEIDKYATQIYQKHFPTHHNYGNITNINADELPDFDLLVGGFPCQSFSIAGKRGGFEDTRGTLFFDIARILRAKQPRLFLLENVKGLLSHDSGKTFHTIIQTLDELGYDLQWQVLNSKNFGVPQNRERVFIVGHSRGTSRPEVFPITGQSNQNSTVGKSAETTVARTLTGGGHTGGNHSGMTILQVADYRNDEGLRIRKDFISPNLTNRRHSETDISTMPPLLVGSRIRRLTPTECERLQGFPDGFTDGISDSQRYKCLGNAVTVNVIEAIIKKII